MIDKTIEKLEAIAKHMPEKAATAEYLAEALKEEKPHPRPESATYWKWVNGLQTGDGVVVCDWTTQQVVYRAIVKRTPTGQIRIPSYPRNNWAILMRVTTLGGEDHYISPV